MAMIMIPPTMTINREIEANTNQNNINANNTTTRNNNPPINFNEEANTGAQSDEDKPFNYFRDIPSLAFRDLKEDIVTEIRSLKIKNETESLKEWR